jgi:hypothetical protein
MSSDPEHRVDDPVAAMERMKSALKQIMTVSKEEIVRRERAANLPARNSKKTRKNAHPDIG